MTIVGLESGNLNLFVKILSRKPVIEEVEKAGRETFVIKRKNKKDLKVYVTEFYILGIADVHQILEIVPDIDAIVTWSRWFSFTNEAVDHCKKLKIGLFQLDDFLTAINHEDAEFLSHFTRT